MLQFLARRIVLALLVGLTVLSISFALTRLSGDLAISIAGANATHEDIALVRRNYGLDRPLAVLEALAADLSCDTAHAWRSFGFP
jgi:peptide/nickel transport system permease protein